IDRERKNETVAYERRGRLIPARVEGHAPGAAGKVVDAPGAARGQKLKMNLYPLTELGRHVHTHGKIGARRRDRILERDGEEPLVPVEVGVQRQRRTTQVGTGGGIALERRVRRKRDPRLAARWCQRRAVLEQLDLTGRRGRRRSDGVLDARQVEVARP